MMDQDIFCIKDRVVCVTGGSGGIGYGLVKGLVEHGAQVAVLGRDREKLERISRTFSKQIKGTIRCYSVDVTDEESVEAAFSKIYEDFGSIYGLVNCAGTSCVSLLSEMSMEQWQKVMDVNVKGTVICSKVAGKYMYANKEGRIVNISSLAATHGKPGYTAYTPSKAAINGFTFTLAAEWARIGINVNSVSPTLVVTDINRKKIETDPEYLDSVLSNIPNGKLCSAERLIGTIVFLLSPASEYITGQNIGCDGGSQNGDIAVIKPPTSMWEPEVEK